MLYGVLGSGYGLGRDSELAATLAQGKPVLDTEYRRRLYSEKGLALLSYFEHESAQTVSRLRRFCDPTLGTSGREPQAE